MEDLNPYRAPTIDTGRAGSSTVSVLLRIGAVVCWLLASAWLTLMVLMLLNKPAKTVFDDQPHVLVVIFAAMFVSPAAGAALIGASAWWRCWRLALYGAGFFIPLGVFVVLRAYFE